MPVTTDTFWNIRRLNVYFLIAASLLLLSTVWFVLSDYTRTWRGYQQQARVWQTALTRDAMAQAGRAQVQKQLADLESQLQKLRDQLPHDDIAKLQQEAERQLELKNKLSLKLAVKKGEIGPKTQQLERAKLEFGDDSPQARDLRKQLAAIQSEYDAMFAQMAGYDEAIAAANAAVQQKQAEVRETEKQIGNIHRGRQNLEDKLAALDPHGAGWVGEKLRNAPLLDWMNPSENVQQVVVPSVLTDYNFVQVETIDRCATCHVNIDNPAFEPQTQVAFIERQIAVAQGQDMDHVGNLSPVVMIDFWHRAAASLGQQAQAALAEVDQAAMARLSPLLTRDDRAALDKADEVAPRLAELVQGNAGSDKVAYAQWYAQARYYVDDLQSALRRQVGDDPFKMIREMYRRTLIDQYNEVRAKQGLRPVSDDPVLLGHPRMDLYAEVESKHPMKSMGCTVCHEGAGQETNFTHATHVPREIWVDARTGQPLPDSMIAGRIGSDDDIDRLIRRAQRATEQTSTVAHDPELVTKLRSAEVVGEQGHVASHERYSHADLNLNDPHDPAPFAPRYEPHGDVAAYQHPLDDPGLLRRAVRQSRFWSKRHHWEQTHYTHWEKPMHSLDYVQSSCAKCHTEVFDIAEEAPKLFEGRRDFVAFGCANCHAVTSLENALDVRKIGPSLVHVKDKLSDAMTASWIWSPKAFRPTTKMPHYFMLENNSSPVDILRTRVEVAAMTHYLRQTPPADGKAYKPQTPPAKPGDADAGHKLFQTVGCLACHANMADTGEQWIVSDLMQREHMSAEDAAARYKAMDYNQQQWYAREHLQKLVSCVGPELSGVGTKLKAGRSESEARTWVYDWLRNPTHYSDSTIMPSFRLSEQEAGDLAAYLLSLDRPGYEPVDFLKLDSQGQEMLFKLVASLKAGGQMPLEAAEQEVKSLTREQQLDFLGKKSITYYGCNGCHAITGFENAPSACVKLDDWGTKDPHKLDFGYFADGFDRERAYPLETYKVDHEGLAASAPAITVDSPALRKQELSWEHVASSRRPWLYEKLHNTRVYDRGRQSLDGSLGGGIHVGRPYDKLKMPKFFLTDDEVHSLVTYVTSIRKPLVKPELIAATYSPAKMRQVHGRQLATLLNCYGCHNIEGNDVQIQHYFGTHKPDGSFNADALNWAPPRLVGQGAKTQPDWVYHFVRDVQPIRPWLHVRMPSFALSPEQARVVVDYFSGATDVLAGQLAATLQPIERWLSQHEGGDWFEQPSLARQIHVLEHLAERLDLATPGSLDPRRVNLEGRRTKWSEVLAQFRTLASTWTDTSYPYVEELKPNLTDMDMARGQRLFGLMGCMAGQCHRLGDEQLLASAGLLVKPTDAADAAAAAEDDAYGDDSGSDAKKTDDTKADDGYGEDDGYGSDAPAGKGGAEVAKLNVTPKEPPAGSPNLVHVAQRLQHRWGRHWLTHATTIQPGTRMQQFWAKDDSFFKPFPPESRKEKEDLFGQTAQEQKDILVAFLYAASRKNLTLNI
ncbi:MAG: c-type cytochrome, partial [Phycisphaeraceae bacterium]|nr:c-type cytochrome [Phycisphaeraceae bacterium]